MLPNSSQMIIARIVIPIIRQIQMSGLEFSSINVSFRCGVVVDLDHEEHRAGLRDQSQIVVYREARN